MLNNCCNNDTSFADKLESIDWSFPNRHNGLDLEAIHPYPAKFVGDIPRSFLHSLPLPVGTAVLDPFCGSGTTLTESQKAGVPSVGIDLNPIACLISRVKTAPMPSHLQNAAEKVIMEAKKNINPERGEIPNVDHWFKPEIQVSIAAIIEAINSCSSSESQDALRLALSSIIVRVSNQESDTRYAAIEKKVNHLDVFDLFLASCEKIKKALSARNWRLTETKVIESDVLRLRPESIGAPVGMVITSPPYPNAYEYWLYHKYRMWWLGFDALAVKKREIGARAHFFTRDHHTEDNFWEQIRGTFSLIDAVLVKSGFTCFVIGRSKIHGRIINNADIITTIAKEYDMNLVAKIERIISPHRKSFNLSHANIKTETIIVFQK